MLLELNSDLRFEWVSAGLVVAATRNGLLIVVTRIACLSWALSEVFRGRKLRRASKGR